MLVNIITWIVVGAVVGWLASLLMKRKLSLLSLIIIGILGSLLGGFIAKLIGISVTTFSVGGLLVAIGGACLLLLLLKALK